MTYSRTVAIVSGNSQFNVVDSYYKQVPYETAASGFTLRIDKVVRVKDLTFEKLLETMIAESSSYDMFMVVDHGVENSLKKVWRLSMPLTAKTTMKTRDDVLAKLLKFMNDDSSEADMTDFEKNHNLKQDGVKVPGLPKGCVSRIVGLMKQLRRCKVRWVSFRACALGNNMDFMETLGQCFSALFVNAPNVHMFYSQPLKPTKKASETSYDSFVKTHAGCRTFDDGAGDELALQVQGTGPMRNVKGSTTAKELHWFMDQKFDKGHKYPSGDHYFPFQIVGMDTLGSNKFALPTEPEYAQSIVWTKPLPGNQI